MSATCTYCDREMNGVACTVPTYDDFPDGLIRDRVPLPEDWPCPCVDCRTPAGGLHHPGCDTERCPGCGGQAISCWCIEEGDA